METLLAVLRGPVFILTFSFFVLGLVRELLLASWSTVHLLNRAGDKSLDVRRLTRRTLGWVLPIQTLKAHPFLLLNSLLFHVSVIVTPLWLKGHITIWGRNLGVVWPGIPDGVADILTITALFTIVLFLSFRLGSGTAKKNTRPQDLLILAAIALPFLSGLLLRHPWASPLGFRSNLLLHLISAEFLFILIPTTKLRHLILFPLLQLVSELGWHWPHNAGTQVGLALGRREV